MCADLASALASERSAASALRQNVIRVNQDDFTKERPEHQGIGRGRPDMPGANDGDAVLEPCATRHLPEPDRDEAAATSGDSISLKRRDFPLPCRMRRGGPNGGVGPDTAALTGMAGASDGLGKRGPERGSADRDDEGREECDDNDNIGNGFCGHGNLLGPSYGPSTIDGL